MALTKVTGDMLGSSVSFGLKSVQTFTSSGTWTKPAGVTKVIVEVQGGGSSGSDGNAASARHTQGGAGGYAKKFIDVSSISSATITVGAGGAGVTSYPSNAGGDSIWSDGTNTVTGAGGATGTPTTSTSTIDNVSFTSGYSASEIDHDSGDILYIENRAPITRAADQTENIKLVIEF